MTKDSYVTGTLYKYSGQLAESTKKPSASAVGSAVNNEASPAGVKPECGRLGPEMELALMRRHEEYMRFRRDARAEMCAFAARCSTASEEAERMLSSCRAASEKLRLWMDSLEKNDAPMRGDPEYQMKLSGVCRELDRIWLDFNELKAGIDKSRVHARDGVSNVNLFAEMDSLSTWRLVRTGFFMALPLIAALLAGCGVVGIFLFLTFRIG